MNENKNFIKIPNLNFNVERLKKSYFDIIKKKKFDHGDGSVTYIDSIGLNRIPGQKIATKENIHGVFTGQNQTAAGKK